MDTLYIVMPAYNEEENIEAVVKDWYPIVDSIGGSSKLIVADSGSSDQTHNILLNLQLNFPRLEVLSETGKQHGPKVIALYNYAIHQGADFIFQTDSDGQTDPSEFDEFWNIRNSYTAILGNRQVREDGKLRFIVEMIVCFLLKLYFDVSVPDANAPFRLMKTTIVSKYLSKLPSDYNLPNVILTAYFAYNEKILFKEITFKQRQGGTNSINITKIAKIGWKSLWDFKMFKKDIKKGDNKNGSVTYKK